MKKAITGLAALLMLSCMGFAAANHGRQKLGGESPEQYIKQEVRHQLILQPYYTIFDNLQYKVDGGTVTLLGEVTDPALKSDAEAAVKHIEGVNKVVNNIQVLPVSPMDNQIRHAEARSIYENPTLFKYSWGALPPIHIIVKNGHVTLTGVVDNAGDKNIAGIQAKSVPNVFSVNNDLRVQNGNETTASNTH
jgi:hyperosmotically inducible protein